MIAGDWIWWFDWGGWRWLVGAGRCLIGRILWWRRNWPRGSGCFGVGSRGRGCGCGVGCGGDSVQPDVGRVCDFLGDHGRHFQGAADDAAVGDPVCGDWGLPDRWEILRRCADAGADVLWS